MTRKTEVVIDLHEIASMAVAYLKRNGLFVKGTPEHIMEAFETDVFNSITQEGTEVKIKNILAEEIGNQMGHQAVKAAYADDDEDEDEYVDPLEELLEMLKIAKRRMNYED